jgi:putative transposase
MFAISAFEEVFKEFGIPDAMRTDNGIPFSCPNALFGLSKLSIWWLRLGINIERIKPGNPQQNGRHERMHLTLKKEATNPPGFSFLQQQDKFVSFIDEYNNDRPHQSLNMKYPAELYTPSTKVYRPPEPPEYPYHDKTIRVTQCGRICLNSKKISFSRVFAGQLVGIREVNDKIWLAGRPYPSFLDFDLGYFDEDDCRVEPLDNPFAGKVLPM